jgi:hypothetical protein
METKELPGIVDLITGKFVRHSAAFHEWRVADRVRKLKASPDDPSLTDDLAVSYDKLGRQAEGIALLRAFRHRNGDRYETIANLGTLHLHAGEAAQGQELIAAALRINPNAHFGREQYQLWLAKYIEESELKTAGVLSTDLTPQPRGFATFVLKKFYAPELPAEGMAAGRVAGRPFFAPKLQPAIHGMLGIMHFGNHRSPVVLEALGDLLAAGWNDEQGPEHAARCYLRAAIETEGKPQAAIYRALAQQALAENRAAKAVPDVEEFERTLRGEIHQADQWFEKIAANEATWIAAGVDVETRFRREYYDTLESTLKGSGIRSHVQVATSPMSLIDRFQSQWRTIYWPVASPMLGLVIVFFGAIWLYLRQRRKTAADAAGWLLKRPPGKPSPL